MKNEPIRDEFLQKRKARQKKARKRRLFISFIALIIALVITALTLCLTVFFPIAKINASGSKIYTDEQIIANSGIKLGDNIFTFNSRRAVDLLKAKLPFIEKVEFSRKLPDTLNIKVTDAKAHFCVLQNGEYFNVSKAGWVLEKVAEKQSDIFEIKLNGVKCTVGSKIVFEDKKSEEMLNNVILLLQENNLKINYVDITNKITVKVGVENRFDVNFGTENYLENKVKHLKTMIENMKPEASGSINLSVWNEQNPEGTFVKNHTN